MSRGVEVPRKRNVESRSRLPITIYTCVSAHATSVTNCREVETTLQPPAEQGDDSREIILPQRLVFVQGSVKSSRVSN
jgi:hypothetical protein